MKNGKLDQFEIEAKTSGGAVFEAGVKMSKSSKAIRQVRKNKPMLWPAGLYFTEKNLEQWIEEHDRSEK